MSITRQLINMLKYCTSNRSMEEILLTAVNHYTKEYKDNNFILEVYVKSLQNYISLLEDKADYKPVSKMGQKLLLELEEYENTLLMDDPLKEMIN